MTIIRKLRTIRKRSHEGIITNFHDNGKPKDGSHFICLSVISTHSVFAIDKNHYPQMFLEECECIFKEKRLINIVKMT